MNQYFGRREREPEVGASGGSGKTSFEEVPHARPEDDAPGAQAPHRFVSSSTTSVMSSITMPSAD